MFDERELELVVCGLGEVDMEDWKKHTEYRHCDAADELVGPALHAGRTGK